MVTTSTALTLYLAQAIGLYLILIGMLGVTAPARWQRLMDEFGASAALPLVTGIFAFTVGVTLIAVHCFWTDPLAMAVTAVGWIALIKGAFLIAVPGLLMRIGAWWMTYVRIWAVAVLILGVLLGLAGLFGRVDAGAVIV